MYTCVVMSVYVCLLCLISSSVKYYVYINVCVCACVLCVYVCVCVVCIFMCVSEKISYLHMFLNSGVFYLVYIVLF